MCVERPSTSAEMQLPSAERERLIFVASLSLSPDACVFDCRSDPARSTKCNFDRRTTSESGFLESMAMVKMQCEREEAMFIGVSEIMRLVSPTNR